VSRIHPRECPRLSCRVPEKQWTKTFGEFALIVRRQTRGPQTISFAVVLVAFVAGRWIDITRYDTEHGLPPP
jgi:hypothetical protein